MLAQQNLVQPAPLRERRLRTPLPSQAVSSPELLHELFEASVDREPEQTAVLCAATRLTYRTLDARANRLAHCLRARGVGREDRVAVLLPRSERVYEAMLGILKAGAAYVPLDPDTPAERVAFILADSGARCLVTLAGLADNVATPLLRLDHDAAELLRYPSARISRTQTGTRRQDLCYVIYTSGTTGRPKGVLVEHRNATHLVRAEQLLYKLRPEDRVFQFASVAFDASVEEIWMAFVSGATLVVGTKEVVRAGPEFSALLTRLGVTFFSCVPTFLAMLEQDIPSVRILVLGGEVCPADLIARWFRPGRTVYNTYGPTEATVIATAAVLRPGQPVTIGRPIDGYRVVLLDENLEPVPAGEAGELCIGGPGVARGYLNRPELHAAKFVSIGQLTDSPQRLYRSGDLARYLPDGNLEYLGRADDQVKVRGYRIELSEIEAVLLQCPGVLAAAVTVHAESQRLAAYVVPRSECPPELAVLRARLADRLPGYMVPATLDELPALPLTVAGKVDRRGLPAPRTPLRAAPCVLNGPRTDAERAVVAVWESVLGQRGISITEDFFRDLGGHSLLAAQVVSQLRAQVGFAAISVGDLYANPTAEQLATRGQRAAPEVRPRAADHASSFPSVTTLQYLACAMLQALGVVLMSGVQVSQWLGAFLAYGYFALANRVLLTSLALALGVQVAMTPAVLLLSIAAKWLLVGRIRPGRYPLWGFYYLRFWLARAVVRAAPVGYLTGTPFLALYYRLMGARIGRNVFLGSQQLMTFDVLEIGDDSSIGLESSLDGSTVEGGMLRIAPVRIGQRCWVGNRSLLGGDTVMEDGSGLGPLSMLLEGTTIPAGELWRGSPAAPAGQREPHAVPRCWSPATAGWQLIGVLGISLVPLAAVLPGLGVVPALLPTSDGMMLLASAPLLALSFVINLCLIVWAFKWLLLGRAQAGRFPLRGSYYVRTWFFDKLMDLTLEVLGPLYSTLYLRPWLRALGARIGKRSEVSTIRHLLPDLLLTGPECFLADDVAVGAPTMEAGWFTLGLVQLGTRTFVGNSALLPPGAELGNNVLLGVLSSPPARSPEGTSWLGSPAIPIPSFQRHGFAESATYQPSARLYALRLLAELLRILLPSTLFVALASLILAAANPGPEHLGLVPWAVRLPLLYVGGGGLAILAAVLVKWLLVGRYRPGQHPLWSSFVWRTELVTCLYESLAVPFLLDLLRGTPFLGWCLRALGAKVGRRCYLDSTLFTEFDLIEIGDEAALNEDANLQTHLFQDRVMTTERVRIGKRCALGAGSAVLQAAVVEDGVAVGDLSLIMKGERLPAGTRWQGTPARAG